jgi:hypothetical protein
MALKQGKPKVPPSEPRKDKQRETCEAVIQDADKTEARTVIWCTVTAGPLVSAMAKT